MPQPSHPIHRKWAECVHICGHVVYPPTMAKKESAFRIRVEEELHRAFLDACRSQDVPAAQILRHFMRRYVEEHQIAAQQSLFQESEGRMGAG